MTWDEAMRIQMKATDILEIRLTCVPTSESVNIDGGSPNRVFDLDEGAVFSPAKHGVLDYQEALDLADGDEHISCTGTCLDGLAHNNKTRCLLGVHGDALTVYDLQSGQLHMPASVEGRSTALTG